MKASVSHLFHPVGQGLFAHGYVRSHPDDRPFVTWVHDCGSDDRAPLAREINRVRVRLGKEPRLDVLILSHFDQDHVNGLRDLLNGVDVGTIVLPYASPADRLLFALGGPGTIDPDHVAYLASPSSYLQDAAASVEQIIYIDAEDGQGPDHAGAPIDVPTNDQRSDASQEKLVPLVSGPNELPAPTRTGSARERYFRGEIRLGCRSIWEFLFFNRRAWRGCVPALQAAVRSRLDVFLAQPVAIRDYGALAVDLRRLYRHPRQFRGGKVGRNDISLITYAGPVGPPRIVQAGNHHYPAPRHHHLDGSLPQNQEGGLLYTGDITMREPLRIALQERLTPLRWCQRSLKTSQDRSNQNRPL